MELPVLRIEPVSSLEQVPTESAKPLSGSEQYFVQARASGVIATADTEEIKAALRYAMVKVGLRAQNFPAEQEKQLLIQHVIDNYGGHTPPEIRLAFDLAINGTLDLSIDDVKCYENFSCLYISTILNAYRKWAAITSKYVPMSNTKLLEAPPAKIELRESIEEAYQHYLKTGNMLDKFYPAGFYNTIVADGYMHPDYYQDVMQHARRDLCGSLQREIAHAMQKGGDYNRARDLQAQLHEINTGQKPHLVELRAKQGAMRTFFRRAAELGYKKIYIKE